MSCQLLAHLDDMHNVQMLILKSKVEINCDFYELCKFCNIYENFTFHIVPVYDSFSQGLQNDLYIYTLNLPQ